jgi:hypothetical protein
MLRVKKLPEPYLKFAILLSWAIIWFLAISTLIIFTIFIMADTGFRGFDIPGLTREPDRLFPVIIVASFVLAWHRTRQTS